MEDGNKYLESDCYKLPLLSKQVATSTQQNPLETS
jgi:hypothetical protein